MAADDDKRDTQQGSEQADDATLDGSPSRDPGRYTPEGTLRADGTTGGSLARDLVLYTLGRLAMIAVVAAVLLLARVPLLVALAVAVVVALPLSLVVLRTLRVRVATGLAERSARRFLERERLMAELRGTAEPEDLSDEGRDAEDGDGVRRGGAGEDR